MSEGKSTSEARLFAAAAQQRFEFYGVGLTFTLLAAAINTADFGQSRVADSLELAAWLILLGSGLCGLWRLSRYGLVHARSARIDENEASLRVIREAAESGAVIQWSRSGDLASPSEAHALTSKELEIHKRDQKRTERGGLWAYRGAVFAFVVGLCALVGARAYVPVSNLLNAGEQSAMSAGEESQ